MVGETKSTQGTRRGDRTVRPIVAGVGLSHADRLIYPELGISKFDLAMYYDSIAQWILPHIRGRPLTLVHCPEGIESACRYLRHAKAWGPTPLRRVTIQEKTKVGEYLVAESISAVVALAQMGIVEIHTWNSTIDDLERPNRIVWDLDPGPHVPWGLVVVAARLLRDVLGTLRLRAWVKTTGGSGLHVVVPLRPSLDWTDCLAFSRAVAEALERADPTRYTTTFRKSGRERKILVDYLRNNRTNTSICAYSPRARPGAVVSMPVTWEGLRQDASRWTLPTVKQRLRRVRIDPWADYWKRPQQISRTSIQALKDLSNSPLLAGSRA
jgi:bifunctional non-homologous end joining protein LigD